MNWPAWLSGAESFAIGALVGWVAAMLVTVWRLDRPRAPRDWRHVHRDRALFDALHGAADARRQPLVIVRKQIHL